MQAVNADTSSSGNPDQKVTLLQQAKKIVFTVKDGEIKSEY